MLSPGQLEQKNHQKATGNYKVYNLFNKIRLL
jgi:hypothetical protein